VIGEGGIRFLVASKGNPVAGIEAGDDALDVHGMPPPINEGRPAEPRGGCRARPLPAVTVSSRRVSRSVRPTDQLDVLVVSVADDPVALEELLCEPLDADPPPPTPSIS
jgi:hypothetical protein